jgi:hypothetical protein
VSVTVVTGYVPISCTHRSTDEYLALGARLWRSCDSVVAFRGTLEKCWLYRDGIQPGGKDSEAYFVVTHEKSRWLAAAADLEESHAADTLVWFDYGMLHNAELDESLVIDFLAEVSRRKPQQIISPSGLGDVHDTPAPCWMFLGGTLIVPRHLAKWFHDECVAERAWPTTWEVNTWAAVKKRNPDKFAFYNANHNRSLLSGYLGGGMK